MRRSRSALLKPLFLLAVVTIAALFPALFQGKIPAETNLLTQFGPWAPLPYKGHPITSGGDSFFAFLPDRLFAVQEWKAGHFPLWNPYVSGGIPILGAQTANPLDPLILLHFFLPTGLAMGLGYLLLLFAAGSGMILFLRDRGIRNQTALAVGGVAFALNPYFIYWLELRVFVAGLALLPLALWASERILAAPRLGREAAFLAVTIGYAAVAGTLQTFVIFLGVLVVRIFWVVMTRRRLSLDRSSWAEIRVASLALLIGIGIGFLSLWSGFELLTQSTRVGSAPGYYAESNFLSWRVVALWFSPEAFGWPDFKANEVLPFFHRTVAASSGWGALGILPLYLALGALVFRAGPRGERLFWGGLAALPLIMLFLMKTALHTMLSRVWPGFDHIDLLRILFLVNLGGSILAAWGAAALIESLGRRRTRRWAILLLLFSGFGVLALVSSRTGWTPPHGLGRNVLPLAVIGGGTFAVLLGSPRRAWILPCLIAIELGRVHFHFNTFGPPGSDFPERPLLTEMQSLLGPPDYYRFYVPGTCRALPPNTASIFHLPDIRGYSTLPIARYRALLECAEGSVMNNRSYIWRPSSQVYRLLGGAYVLIYAGGEMTGPMFEPYSVPGTEDQGFFRRLDAMPRAFLMHQGTILSPAELNETLYNLGFDPASRLVADPAAEPLPAMEPAVSQEQVSIIRYESTKVVIRAVASAPAILVLTDAFYPGWRASVNGTPSRILPVYWGLRGIGLSPGSHEVVFDYRPRWLLPGVILSAGCLALALGALFARHTRRMVKLQ